MVHLVIPEGEEAIPAFAYRNRADITEVTFPASLRCIHNYAFRSCVGITRLRLPDALAHIGAAAFSGCTGIVDVHFPEALESLGDDAFSDCFRITALRLPDALTSLPDNAFAGCEGVVDLQLPDALRAVGVGAFSQCGAITTLRLPTGLESIGHVAFSFSNITTLILPAGLKSIGEGDPTRPASMGAFAWCTGLARVLAPDHLVRGEMADPAKVFGKCPVLVAGLTPLSSVKLPRRTFWHPTMHHWCTPAAKLSVAAVLVAELRVARQGQQRLPHLPHELWLLVLEFVARRELGPPRP